MKIACVSPDDLSTIIFCKTLSRLLAKKEGVELITISGGVEGLSEEAYRDDIRKSVLSRHINLPMKRFISPVHDLSYFLRLYKILRKEKCSVIITFTTKPNIYGQLAARLSGVPSRVMAVRGLGRIFDENSSVKGKLLKKILVILYRCACASVNKVWFTNVNDLNDFVSNGIIEENKTFLTKNAVDLTDFCNECIDAEKLKLLREELGMNPEDKVIIMVARLIEQKGVKEFAEASAILKKEYPNLYFLLVDCRSFCNQVNCVLSIVPALLPA